MRQIISGETHNISIHDKKSIQEFLETNNKLFNDLEGLLFKNCIYSNSKIINDSVLNYLNVIESNPVNKEIKKILRKEFDTCEKLYPYLGDIFINMFFGKFKQSRKNNLFKFSKKHQQEIIESISNDHVKQVANIFFENFSLEYFTTIKTEKTDELIIIKNDDLVFDLEFDNDYYVKLGNKNISNYNFIVVDGLIDTVGEIHHLLHSAAENKENYVIFCHGINPEVKHTIIKNNERGITKVYPIDIKFNESAINILNDIAVVHSDDVVSSFKGQTISQAVRKKLKKGKNIKIENNKFVVTPVCKESDLQIHRNFLKERLLTSSNETNKKYLEKRYKRMNTKSAEIIIPEYLITNNTFVRELDYFLRFLANSSKTLLKIKNINNKKFYYIPQVYIEYVKEKSNKTNQLLENIDKVIISN